MNEQTKLEARLARQLLELREEKERLRGALEKHHKWHLEIGTVFFPPDGEEDEVENGMIELDLTDAYCESSLYIDTVCALASLAPKGEQKCTTCGKSAIHTPNYCSNVFHQANPAPTEPAQPPSPLDPELLEAVHGVLRAIAKLPHEIWCRIQTHKDGCDCHLVGVYEKADVLDCMLQVKSTSASSECSEGRSRTKTEG